MTAKYFLARASGLALGWLSVRLTVTLGLRSGIGLGLGIWIADLNQITDLKRIQIADLNLTPSKC